MEQLQVFNPNDGKWYLVGPAMEWREVPIGAVYMYRDGKIGTKTVPACSVGLVAEYNILTPCNPPKEFTLGQDIAKHIRDGDVLVANGVVPPGNFLRIDRGNDEFMIQAGRSNSDSATVFLFARPLPPPAPEPKTSDDYLGEIIKIWRSGSALGETIDAAENHIATQTDTE